MFVLGEGRTCQKNTDKFDILKTKIKDNWQMRKVNYFYSERSPPLCEAERGPGGEFVRIKDINKEVKIQKVKCKMTKRNGEYYVKLSSQIKE